MVLAISVSGVHVSAFVWTSACRVFKDLCEMGEKVHRVCDRGIAECFQCLVGFSLHSLYRTNLLLQSIFVSTILL
jgi:hypothetical protein